MLTLLAILFCLAMGPVGIAAGIGFMCFGGVGAVIAIIIVLALAS